MTDELPLSSPPYSPAAEQAVLGAVIIDPECIRALRLQPDDFYIRRNGWIYNACQEITRAGKTPDYITICSHLDGQGRLAEVGGSIYIMDLINACPSSMNVESYAAVVEERAYRRGVLNTCAALTQCAYDIDGDLQAGVSAAMDRLSKAIVTNRGAAHISEYLMKVYEAVGAASQIENFMAGVPTGFIDWDKLGGIGRKQVFRLAGDPGVGKSLLSMQVLEGAAKAGKHCALYEIEMEGELVGMRLISAETRIPTRRIEDGRLTAEEWELFTKAIEKLSKLNVYMSDASELTTTDIRVDCQRLKDLNGLDIIVIDYEALLSDQISGDTIERQNVISGRVKALAKDLDIAVISIGDMTKEGIQGKSSGQGAMAGSGRTLHNADQIATLHADKSIKNKYNLVWNKNRKGSPDQFVSFTKLEGYPMFGDYAKPANAQSFGGRA